LLRLRDWFADAHRVDDGMDDSLPFPFPPMQYHRDYPRKGKDGRIEFVSGWISTEDESIVPAEDVPAAFVAGHARERAEVDAHAKHLEEIRRTVEAGKVAGEAEPEVDEALASMESQLRRAKRFVALTDWWRRRRIRRQGFGDGADSPILLAPQLPWWEAAVDLGRVSKEEFQAVRERARGWAWPRLEDSHARWVAFAEAAGLPPPELPTHSDEVLPLDDLLAHVLKPGGEEILARYARLAVRLDAVQPSRAAEPVEVGPVVLEVPGEPDPRRLTSRILTIAERQELFGGDGPEGSAGEPGRPLPVGGVVVVLRDGTAPYLRGRGWHVRPDGLFIAWDWRGEPGRPPFLVPRCHHPHNPPDPGAVPFGDHVGRAGHRWWNLQGSGLLADETPDEWEDRRDRARLQAMPLIESGAMTPGMLRFFAWTLAGHAGGPWPDAPGLGEWRPRPVPFRPLGDEIAYEAGPATQRSEWSDVALHDRHWSAIAFPAAFRAHPLVREIEGRLPADGDSRPWHEVWADAVAEAVDLSQPPPCAGMLPLPWDEYWAWIADAEAFAESSAAAMDARVEEHRAWMRENASLVLIVADGPLRAIPWTHDAYPEPLLPPAVMDIPLFDHPVGVDFTTLPDQGNGFPDDRPPWLRAHREPHDPEESLNLSEAFRPEAAARVAAALAGHTEPVYTGNYPDLAPDDPEALARSIDRVRRLLFGPREAVSVSREKGRPAVQA
jgi:hypothetical protein